MSRLHPTVKVEESVRPANMIDSWVVKDNVIADICVNIAIAGTPLSFFDKADVRELTTFAMKGAGVKHEELTTEKIRAGVVTKAKRLREVLKEKLKGRKVNISADFGTRHSTDFLGEF